MFCIFCESEVEDYDFNCLKHKTCPCGFIMLDCSEIIAYKQISTYKSNTEAKPEK